MDQTNSIRSNTNLGTTQPQFVFTQDWPLPNIGWIRQSLKVVLIPSCKYNGRGKIWKHCRVSVVMKIVCHVVQGMANRHKCHACFVQDLATCFEQDMTHHFYYKAYFLKIICIFPNFWEMQYITKYLKTCFIKWIRFNEFSLGYDVSHVEASSFIIMWCSKPQVEASSLIII